MGLICMRLKSLGHAFMQLINGLHAIMIHVIVYHVIMTHEFKASAYEKCWLFYLWFYSLACNMMDTSINIEREKIFCLLYFIARTN